MIAPTGRDMASVLGMRRPIHAAAPVVLALAVLLAAGCSSSATNSSGASSGGKSTGSKVEFCSLLIAFRASNDTLDADVNSGDTGRAQAAVKRLVAQAQSLETKAPSDIRSDVAVAASFLSQLDVLLAQYGYDLTKLSADPTASETFTALNSAAVQTSLNQLRAYGDTDCADAPTSTTSPTAATTPPVETSTTAVSPTTAAAPTDAATVAPAVPVATG
ncbi:MAG: hypothetical protein JWN62_903 [Acidimicrobiales bacterium]|nr:hypothetical protein [Acidimicrobiales bacterium]